ncbi:hypothetical protein Pyn_07078 [Prunus yedoensis var. nudiflora]|uniref:Uncharacterized protein n=1 Tax=Prunus yedoensis var. nudiflora TaxID=2094558 RepID=A0A315AYJ7_PRUYE|nr:hypothetical protein Pyn_07078 [Prunus yedoensis var. nudiflora]
MVQAINSSPPTLNSKSRSSVGSLFRLRILGEPSLFRMNRSAQVLKWVYSSRCDDVATSDWWSEAAHLIFANVGVARGLVASTDGRWCGSTCEHLEEVAEESMVEMAWSSEYKKGMASFHLSLSPLLSFESFGAECVGRVSWCVEALQTVVSECRDFCVGSSRKMSSRLDMSDSQETPSSGSAFRDDKDEEDVVDQMYEAADQMGEDMPIGLGGTFEYRGVERSVRVRGVETEHVIS